MTKPSAKPTVLEVAAHRGRFRMIALVCALVLGTSLAHRLVEAAPLSVEAAGAVSQIDAAALAARPDAVDLELVPDPNYKAPMRYRVVPLAAIARELGVTDTDTLEAVASDGFAAQLPGRLVLQQADTGPRAWLAIELPAEPWPPLPGKPASAGPFYVVWSDDTGIGPEQWPYMVVKLARRQPPEQRWPQMAVSAELPADHPARKGLAHYVKHCMACHKLDGAGEATIGPDLQRPMNPAQYLQPQALRQLIRDPASVRDWPGRAMPAFAPEQLPDAELDELLAYLGHLAARQTAR
jgi:mono/diheme cytochrome c family protein